jgi:hypothetical protein
VALLLLSLITLTIGALLSSILVVTGSIVVGIAGTTTAVLSLRED